jgi:hypothetical protein
MRHNTDGHVLVPNVIATTNAEDCDRSDAFDDPGIVANSMSALGQKRTCAAHKPMSAKGQ